MGIVPIEGPPTQTKWLQTYPIPSHPYEAQFIQMFCLKEGERVRRYVLYKNPEISPELLALSLALFLSFSLPPSFGYGLHSTFNCVQLCC